MAEQHVVKIGILGAANIAHKNVAGILKANNIGAFCNSISSSLSEMTTMSVAMTVMESVCEHM